MPSRRTLGIYVVSAVYVVLGLASFAAAPTPSGPAFAPESVDLFLTVAPVFFVVLGLFAVVVVVGLWAMRPWGRIAGLVWIGLWLAEEIALVAWGQVGPETIREASGGVVSLAVPLVVGGVLAYYLWAVVPAYVEQ